MDIEVLDHTIIGFLIASKNNINSTDQLFTACLHEECTSANTRTQ